MLRIVFEQRCGYYMKGQAHIVRALSIAFRDYLSLRRGAVDEWKLEPNKYVETPLESLKRSDNPPIFRSCYHVKEVRDIILPEVYVDRYGNCLPDKSAYDFYRALEMYYGMFYDMYISEMWRAIKLIRRNADMRK